MSAASIQAPQEGSDLVGKIALITGASSDLGEVIATVLAGAGVGVVLHANRSRQRVEALADQLNKAGGRADVVQCELGSATDSRKLIDRSAEIWQGLDILVNNAGGSRTPSGQDGFLIMQSEEHIAQVLSLNLNTALYCSRYAIRYMLKSRAGSIVNIGSLSGLTGVSGQVAYSAAKAGLHGMTRSLATEMGPKGIRVNAIAPGFIESSVVESMPEERVGVKNIPLRRLGQPVDVANAVRFLVSNQASYITGSVLNVNGGLFTGAS